MSDQLSQESGALGSMWWIILEWSTHHDLLVMGVASPGLNSEVMKDRHWQELAKIRWSVNTSLQPKVFGGSTWSQAYKILDAGQRLPRGQTLIRSDRVFAKGRLKGVCDVWAGLAHTPNCCLTPATALADRRSCNTVELRVMVQSTWTGCLAVDLAGITLDLYTANVNPHLPGSVSTLSVLSRRLVAVEGRKVGVDSGSNHASSANGSTICLRPLGTFLVSLTFACPSDVQFETDFLVRATALVVSCTPWSTKSTQDASSLALEVASSEKTPKWRWGVFAKFIEEDIVHEHYEQVSSGFLVLTERGGLGVGRA